MSDLDDEFDALVNAIREGKKNFEDHEQNIIDAWIVKLSELSDSDEDKKIRSDYANVLAKVTNLDKQLSPPFNELPTVNPLPPLVESTSNLHHDPGRSGSAQKSDHGQRSDSEQSAGNFSYPIANLPCSSTKGPPFPAHRNVTSKIKKPEKERIFLEPKKNLFEDYKEMGRAIAQSKGHSFAEFVMSISRYTADYGQQLRTAMKIETNSFREYVEHVFSQRIKDLTEVLDEEQSGELQSIKRDIDKWQVELSHCKKRIREMIPNFDIEAYKRDKFYLKKIFVIANTGPGLPEDDSFKKWREENCHRIKWYTDIISKMTNTNNKITQEISSIQQKMSDIETKEANKQQEHIQCMSRQLEEYQKLKVVRDKVSQYNAILLSQLERLND